ncbi:amidohydrolase [Phenylobacterium sp.]|uniref:amidohydrolase n=1 Tax=Phenylobacterium sp. TaxID=1871053 RepID=UPI002735D8C3|nr:amidohydrolase [Phenylobacterium sp.]MDP3855182.1 amidohydrolase [Phenylobacterium sp.]
MRVHILRVATAALLACASSAAAQDLLIHGGPIHTGEASVEALAIKDGKVAFAGPVAQARRAVPGAKDIDLKGAAAFPGFVDAHAHLSGIGFREMTLSLEGTASVEDLVARLKGWNAANPGTGPVSGRGWIETHWPEKRFPSRQDLDRAVSDRPVVLGRADGHAIVANTAMLALAGVTRDTVAPAGGQILKDPSGEPTGMLIDNAMGLVRGKVPPPSAAAKAEAVKRGVDLYASRGWTGLHDMGSSSEEVGYQRALAANDRLPIRVDNYMSPQDAATVLSAGPSQDPTGLVRVRGVKMYMDGALGSRGAALLAPYADAEGTGLILTPRETIDGVLKQARASGAQIAVHAIGDRGNRLVLDAFEQAFGGDTAALKAARWRVEHAQVLSPQDLPRFSKLGVIASMQASHAIGDLYFAPARLGPERLKGAYAWESLLKSGAVVAGGSDAPVEKGDPLVEFYAAAYRHDLKGFAGPDWGLDEALSRQQALALLTRGPAYAAGREGELGLLKAGAAADISVFSVDLMTAPFPEIAKARAVMTVVAGKVVYDGR